MTNLLLVLPDFDPKPYTHILPSLEKALVSTADLLTLDASDNAKRAQVPAGEVSKLVDGLLEALHGECGLEVFDGVSRDHAIATGTDLIDRWRTISTLDDGLDAALNGGIAAGHVTEFVGESAAGKTQFLLTLLLSVQLPAPQGLAKSALYISTEAPLQTTRLSQILDCHPALVSLPEDDRPSLEKIQSTHIHDLEAQEHILRYQVPVAITRHNVGLIVVDSIAANYRAEFDKRGAKKGIEGIAKRSAQLTQLGTLLRDLARTHGIAVVVANQVADRFEGRDREAASQHQHSQSTTQKSRPPSPPSLQAQPFGTMSTTQQDTSPASQPPSLSTDDPLALDHQHRFFTGWGADPFATNLKTPSLGLIWANQLSTRIALTKGAIYDDAPQIAGADREVKGWHREMCVVYSAWYGESRTEFAITGEGVRSVSAKNEGTAE